jgi:hypothetical protein
MLVLLLMSIVAVPAACQTVQVRNCYDFLRRKGGMSSHRSSQRSIWLLVILSSKLVFLWGGDFNDEEMSSFLFVKKKYPLLHQVLDFRLAAVQKTLTNSSSYSYQPPFLDLLAKLGSKTQGQGSWASIFI